MARNRQSGAWAVALACGVLAGAGPAAAQDASVSAGVSARFVSGTFGSAQTTNIVYAPASIRVDVGRFEFGGYFPFVSVHDGTVLLSQGGFVPMQGSMSGAPAAGMPMRGSGFGGMGSGMGGGMMGAGYSPSSNAPFSPSSAPALMSQSGPGDVVATAAYRLVDSSNGVQVVLGARLKAPTASAEDGLGTGKADVAGTVTVRKRLARGWIYGDAGFVKIGTPDGADLDNAFLWGVGGGRQLSPRVFVLGAAYGNTAVVSAFGAPAEISAGLGFKIGERVNLTVMPLVGLNDASPRYGVTVGISSDMIRR